MADLDKEESPLKSLNKSPEVASSAAAAAPDVAHALGLVAQQVFVSRLQESKTVMDLLQCVLDLEEILASVAPTNSFNGQQIRRAPRVVHTNYVMLPLFPTPIPDELMRTPQLSMIAARVYNLEYAVREMFQEQFDDRQKKKYYKKRKSLGGTSKSYNMVQKQQGGGGKRAKIGSNSSSSSSSSPSSRVRGSQKPAELCGLLTIDGAPIEVCTTCGGKSTRKNGSNRGKMQRWCVDCQKSHRVRDALTPEEQEKEKLVQQDKLAHKAISGGK
jgi:hypothetical protein